MAQNTINYLKTAFICRSGGKYSFTRFNVFHILPCIEPSSSVPNLLNSRVNSMNSQSCKSLACKMISSLTVSKNKAYTLVCVSMNIFRNKSSTACNWSGVKSLPSDRYCVKLVRPSLRSAQCVDEQKWMIVSMSSISGRSSLLREPFHEPDCIRKKHTKLQIKSEISKGFTYIIATKWIKTAFGANRGCLALVWFVACDFAQMQTAQIVIQIDVIRWLDFWNKRTYTISTHAMHLRNLSTHQCIGQCIFRLSAGL